MGGGISPGPDRQAIRRRVNFVMAKPTGGWSVETDRRYRLAITAGIYCCRAVLSRSASVNVPFDPNLGFQPS
jgi:hypothetical protein